MDDNYPDFTPERIRERAEELYTLLNNPLTDPLDMSAAFYLVGMIIAKKTKEAGGGPRHAIEGAKLNFQTINIAIMETYLGKPSPDWGTKP